MEGRNVYISPDEQVKIKNTGLLFCGVSRGGVIAECALKLGFEKITLIDGSIVDEHDINSQNYSLEYVGEYKAVALKHKLEDINPKACVNAVTEDVDSCNINELVRQHSIAVNTIGIDRRVASMFEHCCRVNQVPVVHSYNLGWAGVVVVVDPIGRSFDYPSEHQDSTTHFIRRVADYYRYWGAPHLWLENAIENVDKESLTKSFPELSVASYLVGGLATTVLFDLAVGNKVKKYPQFYMLTAKD